MSADNSHVMPLFELIARFKGEVVLGVEPHMDDPSPFLTVDFTETDRVKGVASRRSFKWPLLRTNQMNEWIESIVGSTLWEVERHEDEGTFTVRFSNGVTATFDDVDVTVSENSDRS